MVFRTLLLALCLGPLAMAGPAGPQPARKAPGAQPPEPALHDGDIIFHASASPQSQAIQLATRSPYSHCGVLYRKAGAWHVIEAVQPVSSTPLTRWITRGAGQHYVVKRLRNAGTALTPAVLQQLRHYGEQALGKDYDPYFGWSDDRLYCSELVWKMFKQATGQELGRLQTLREFDLRHPVVRQKLRERYGDRVPLAGKVISPAEVFNSPRLIEVVRH